MTIIREDNLPDFDDFLKLAEEIKSKSLLKLNKELELKQMS